MRRLVPRYFEFYCISQLLEGRGLLWQEATGETIEFKPGEAVLMTPDTIHDYGGNQDKYLEDTICFTGPVADQLYQSGIIKSGIIYTGKTPRLRDIAELAADPAADSQISANIAMQKLLVDLYLENKSKQSGDRYSKVKKLIKEIQLSPEKWWTVREMSEYCNLSEMHFRRVFREHTGMAPKIYIDNLKIQKAARALSGSDDSITEIAESLGYTDPFHFSRRFKQLTGLSPVLYRREMMQG
jgi:AraC-like DNA-binding protein